MLLVKADSSVSSGSDFLTAVFGRSGADLSGLVSAGWFLSETDPILVAEAVGVDFFTIYVLSGIS